jgi:hypothetical protein
MSQTQYLHSYCILDNESASTQQGWLEQTGSPDEISQPEARTRCPWSLVPQNRHFDVVGGCSICSPSQHART